MNNSTDKLLSVRIGVFFDGTGCNAHNVSEDLYTNIYRLYTAYNPTQNPDDGVDGFGKVYIEGVGTMDGKRNDLLVMATGQDTLLSHSGIFSKYTASLDSVGHCPIKISNTQNEMHDQVVVRVNLEFDLFGFSRGAALARHFCNKILSNPADAKIIIDLLYQSGFEVQDIKVNYLGLFDTVASIWGINNLDFRDPHDTGITYGLEVNLPQNVASRVFQINAFQECRYNLPLSDLKGFYPQLELLGAHSDIGGGYGPIEEEINFVSLPEFHTSSVRSYIENIRKDFYRWGIVIDPDTDCKIVRQYLIYHQAKEQRMEVHGELAYIALLIMAEDATKLGRCSFSNLITEFNAKVPAGLKCYQQDAFNAYKAMLAGKDYSFNENIIKDITLDYIHVSAHFNNFKHTSEPNLNLVRDDEFLSKYKLIEERGQFDSLEAHELMYINNKLDSIIDDDRPNRPDDNWIRLTYPNNQPIQ